MSGSLGGLGLGGGWLVFPTAQTDCACVRSYVLFYLNLRRLVRGGSACYWGLRVRAGYVGVTGWLGFPTAQTDCACVRSSVLFDLNLRLLTRGGSACHWDVRVRVGCG